MKRLLAALVALVLLTSAGSAWFLDGGQVHGFNVVPPAAGPPPDPTIAAQGCTSSTANGSSYTFTAHAIGTASPTRSVVVLVSGEDGAITFSISGVTVDGVAASSVVQSTATGSLVVTGIFIITDTADTTDNIVVTFSEAVTSATICVYAVYDLTSNTADATNNDFETSSAAQTLDINTTSPGVALGICNGDGVADSTTTWTGLVEATDANNGEHDYSSAALAPTSAATPLAVTCDWTNTGDSTGVAAAWN